MTRIVIDARPLSHGQPGGFRGYVRSLLHGLAERNGDEELLLYVDRLLSPEIDATLPQRATVRVLNPDRLKTDLRLFGQQVRLDAPDLVMGTVNYLPSIPSGIPAIVTIHDAIGIRPRPWERGHPVSRRAQLMAAYWATMTRRSARKARRIITDTHGAATDLAAALNLPQERFSVVPIGILLTPSASTLPRDTNTVLAFASPEPRKNFAAVLKALSGENRVCFKGKLPRLEIICTYDSGATVTEAALQAHGITDYHLLRRPSDTALADAYARATVFVWPSFYEGFGMPPLEAMLSGCPVVSSTAPAMPEVLGDIPLYADPNSPAAFAKQMASLLADADARCERGELGRAHAARFTCRRMAEETAAVWREVLG
jgi:glycosyltransferase involved in cell wall biosynthesis